MGADAAKAANLRGAASAVIVAAGEGLRMGAGPKKQFLRLGGEPILAMALRAFAEAECIGEIVLVVARGDAEYCEREIVAHMSPESAYGKAVRIAHGGRTRQESVRNGVAAADPAFGLIAIHDGVRPFIEPGAICAAVAAAAEAGASCVAIPATDTIKEARGGYIERTLDRASLWAAQTPQAFRREILADALDAAERRGFAATDDVSLAESIGVRAMIVPGSYDNIKITTQRDLDIAKEILARRRREAPVPR
ncbi:MAG: 2-C-methyl-D-erythritol 4-phosphate cytidylyltransferase [Clostridiales bacterium]|jgi:2-C-methyl-D-erythritol 4-phosphate cytidylyltransferase|nr:2-C-methyl-D-erythritol 4-phosphate cytidylyltransferase [Clostridiales bacterium]